MSTTEHKIRSIFGYLLPSIISNALPFITLPIVTRFLSPQDFGIAALAMSTTLFIISMMSCGIDSATQRYYFEHRKSAKNLSELISSSTIFLFAVMLVTIPSVYLLRGFIARVIVGSAVYASAIFVSYISSCLVVMVNFYLLLYRSMENVKDYSFYRTLQVVGNAILSIILVAIFRFGYMGLIYASMLSSLVPFGALAFRFIKAYDVRFNYRMLSENLRFGVQLLPTISIGSVYQFLDKYMLRAFVSLYSTGIFSVAQNVSSRISIFMTAVQSVFEPIFMKDMFDKGKDGAAQVGRNFTLFTYISLSAILCTILFGEEIIYVLAPPSYRGVVDVFIILISGVAMQTFAKIAGPQLAYAKKAYLSFPVTVAGLAVNLALNLLLIPRFHALGAALATSIAMVVINVIYVVISQHSYRVAYEKSTLSLIYGVIFSSALLLIFLKMTGSPFWIKYMVKLAALAAFVAIGVRAHIITKSKMAIALKIMTFNRFGGEYVEV